MKLSALASLLLAHLLAPAHASVASASGPELRRAKDSSAHVLRQGGGDDDDGDDDNDGDPA